MLLVHDRAAFKEPHLEPAGFPFIVGRGRSGTTLVGSILGSHPDMAIPYESHFPLSMGLSRSRYEGTEGLRKDIFIRDLQEHFGFRRWALPISVVEAEFDRDPPLTLPDAIRRTYAAYALYRGKARYGEKAPGFITSLGPLSQLFPEGRFIHVIRDGRNVALSYIEGGWGPKDVAEAAIYWRRFVSAGRRAGMRLGQERYMEIRYEDLLEDTERHVRQLCHFIGISFDHDMLKYFERSDVVPGNLPEHLARAHQNLQLPPTKGLRDWRSEMSRRDIALFEALAGDLLGELGYERSQENTGIPTGARALRSRFIVNGRRVRRRIGKLLTTQQRM